MAIQLSVAVRNARLDAIETAIGTSPTLEIRSGSPPANCAAADSGTVLATMVLPSDWMAAASSGAKALAGTWQELAADATGTAGHFRLKQGATCHTQGTGGAVNVSVPQGAGGAITGLIPQGAGGATNYQIENLTQSMLDSAFRLGELDA